MPALRFAEYACGKADVRSVLGVAFWLTFVSFLLLALAGCTVCFGRRRDRLDGATTYSWKDRFRKTAAAEASA